MKMFNQISNALLFCLVTQTYSLKAQAWGTVGHYTSAQIALNILTDQNSPALNDIKKILKNDDFVEASVWADEARASTTENWKATSWYHFEKIEDNEQYVPHLKTQTPVDRENGGTLQAIMASETMLLDPNATDDDRVHALKFLIHFIGDIHQPLHTGPVDDHGGNKVTVKWLGVKMNLHRIWDSEIIALGHKDILTVGTKTEQIEKYARYLQEKFKSKAFVDQNIVRYDDWIKESMVPRKPAYTYKGEDANKYTARFLNIVDERIYLAGLRIAYTLNRIFPGYVGPNMVTTKGLQTVAQFRKEVMNIVGDFTKIIQLRPAPLLP